MDRQISNVITDTTDRGKVSAILQGKMDGLPPISARLVRIFISSTFSDMIAERNAMMEHVYPKLKEFCRNEYGLEFQIMDLRWGIQESAHDDHTIINFCLREIKNCKDSSIGPNFVALLGQKYGYRPFPPEIQSDEFIKIRNAIMDSGEDVELVDKWFVRDRNTQPHTYSLWPVSKFIPDYCNNDEQEKYEKAASEWMATFAKIRTTLRKGVSICVQKGTLPVQVKDKYYVSVTEYEIEEGMKQNGNLDNTCLTFVRMVDDLEQHVDNPRAMRFIDLDEGQINHEAQGLLHKLRDINMPEQYSTDMNYTVLHTRWQHRLNDDPNTHDEYLKAFCDSFYENMKILIKQSMKGIENLVSAALVVEVIQHLEMCRNRCLIFRGREGVIEQIQRYVLRRSELPLVVYGVSGCGKTSVLAKASSLIHQWFDPGIEPVLILRFLGTSLESTSVRLLLRSVCGQIAEVYDKDKTDIPSDYSSLISHFHELLKCATAQKPMVIFLDSLDQLSSSHYAHNLVWLPQKLPNNVRLVLSTLPVDHDILPTLQTMIQSNNNYIKIDPLGPTKSMEIIRSWLGGACRVLTQAQMAKVQTALHACNLPLYTKLIFEEVKLWKSYFLASQTTLELTIKGVINKLFERLEHCHGHTFVKHALSYLSASRNGLSDAELEDTMSLDDVLLNKVFTYWVPPTRRIPPLLWPRLLDELKCYIVQREANGLIVHYWYHRQFITVARDRYLSERDHREYIHSILADYYLGTWAGREKPFTYSEINMKLQGLTTPHSQADRKVPYQPLIFGKPKATGKAPLMFGKSPGRPQHILYNLRKLSEMPHHLTVSRRIEDLKREVLFNYNWLHTKLSATSLHDILSDYRSVLDQGIKDEEIQVLTNNLRVGGSYVNNNANTLAFDLLGRLLPFYDKHSNIRSLLQQCDRLSPRHSALLPMFKCFESPSGMLQYILEDHTKVVVDLLFSKSTNELVSVSKDGTVAFWDLGSGEKTRTLDVSKLCPGTRTKLLQSSDGKYLVCDSDMPSSQAYIFDMKTGKCLHQCGKRNPTQKRVFTVQHLMCRQKTIFDMTSGRIHRSLEDFTKSREYVTTTITHDEKHIIIGEEKVTKMHDLVTCKLVASFQGDHIPSRFEVTRDSRCLYIGYAVDCLFKVCDIDRLSPHFGRIRLTFNYQKAFPNTVFLEGPHYGRELAEIDISKVNQYAVLLNIRRCILIVLKVKVTMEGFEPTPMNIKAIGGNNETFLFGSKFSPDERYVLAGEGHFVHIWNSTDGVYLSRINIHSVYKFPLATSPRYNLIATASNIHTAIKVWDINKLHSNDNDLHIYENPVDMVACAWHSRLLFVKRYYSLAAGRGYKYVNCFGLDVWNLNTGRWIKYLAFGQYGQLMQLDVSPDATQLVLLLSVREKSNIVVIDTSTNDIHTTLEHNNCQFMVVSHDRKYVATFAENAAMCQVKLWSLDQEGKEVHCFEDVYKFVFTYDNKYILLLKTDNTLITYMLENSYQMVQVLEKATELQLLPRRHEVVMVTVGSEDEDRVQVQLLHHVDQRVESTLTGVSPDGIKDVAKDGRIAIDSYLQVFDLEKGSKCMNLATVRMRDGEEEKPESYKFVMLTYDGRYAMWVDRLVVRACRLSDGQVVATTSMHEGPTTMITLDYGYMIVIGREDGHVITMKLLDPNTMEDNKNINEEPNNNNQTNHASYRTKTLLKCLPCSPDDIDTFERLYRHKPVSISDKELPKASPKIQRTLSAKGQAPPLIIERRSLSRTDGDQSPTIQLLAARTHRALSEENIWGLTAWSHRGSVTNLLSASNKLMMFGGIGGSLDNIVAGQKKEETSGNNIKKSGKPPRHH